MLTGGRGIAGERGGCWDGDGSHGRGWGWLKVGEEADGWGQGVGDWERGRWAGGRRFGPSMELGWRPAAVAG
jgi:hypothetical protein